MILLYETDGLVGNVTSDLTESWQNTHIYR